ncbi:YhcN/YlaJ family sporulation lipoprotein [Paenibacillus puerhi]|uniref:YhcN/YlaJ family sporulation lipoprotein n=1 Tax=Paenibacillus puerhi TaxID=2692622 RepID=UPI00135C2C08|nr:YhcN/YlaJ family sporulation lipoprotein [Paenibacillus puerhi]
MLKFVSVLLLLSAILSGCASTQRGAAPSEAPNTDRQVRVRQTAPQKKEIQDQGAVAQRLEQIATSVPNVESANCVVFGNTAIVGINVPQGMDRAKVGTVKLSVAEALKKDPYGVDAYVTADMDLGERLRKVRDQLQSGRGLNGLAEEMAAIIGRIIPQMPRDVSPVPGNPQQAEPQLPNRSL